MDLNRHPIACKMIMLDVFTLLSGLPAEIPDYRTGLFVITGTNIQIYISALPLFRIAVALGHPLPLQQDRMNIRFTQPGANLFQGSVQQQMTPADQVQPGFQSVQVSR